MFDGQGAKRHRAGLVLARGVSACGAWVFSASDAGTTIIVGGAATCDWQIASPGVSPFYLSFTGDGLLVRTISPDVRVQVNGRALPPQGWVTLAHGDELRLGPALLTAHLAPALRGAAGKRAPKRKARPSPSRPSAEQGSLGPGSQLMLHDSFGTTGPSLFEDDATPRESRFWYAAVALGTVLTYAVWLAFLDQF